MKNSEEKPVRKRKKRRRKRLKILNLLFVLFLTLILSVSAIGMITVFSIINSSPEIDPTKIDDMLNQSTFIYDYAGNLLEKVSNQDGYRILVSMDEVPDNMRNAIIAIEDERFYEHNGIDLKRVGGALWYNLKTRSLGQGASTITMQLAKNLYTNSEKSYTRKIRDTYYSLEIEKQLSKEEILLAYLNIADFSRNTKGIQAAANTFFNKNVSELTLGECALLAGVPRRPSYYSPYQTEEITPEDNIADLQLLTILSPKEPYEPTEQEIRYYNTAYGLGKIDRFMLSQLKKGDYYLRKATLNPKAVKRQKVVLEKMLELNFITEQEMQEALSEPITIKIGRRKTKGISGYFADILKDEVIRSLVDSGRTQEEAEILFSQGGLRIYSTLSAEIQQKLERIINNPDNYPNSYIDKNGIIQPQISMVIMRPETGEIRALVGGRGIGGNSIYNRAINPRQPGSAIKPIAVYAPALKNGLTAGSVFKDSPRYDETLKKMWPKNSTGYMGQTTMRNLLVRSSNVGAVEIASNLIAGSKSASIREMIDSLQDFGVTTVVTADKDPSHNDENLSLALGGMTNGISPLELTAAYAAIANSGTYTKPIFFTRIEASNGKVLISNEPETRKVMDPANAYILKNMLYGVVNSTSPKGTGFSAKLDHITTAGKTGTTSDKKDAWFVGITPYYASALWIGCDMPKELNEGSAMSARLWKKVMDNIHEGMENREFAVPSNVVMLKISPVTGLLSKSGYLEAFKAGTEPSGYSSDDLITEEDAMYDEDGNLIELRPEDSINKNNLDNDNSTPDIQNPSTPDIPVTPPTDTPPENNDTPPIETPEPLL